MRTCGAARHYSRVEHLDGFPHGEAIMQRVLAAALLLFAVSACIIVGDPTCGGGGAAVIVTPGVVVVAVGESFTPNATDSWCDGGHQSPGSPSWRLAPHGDASIVSLGPITAPATAVGASSWSQRSNQSFDANSSFFTPRGGRRTVPRRNPSLGPRGVPSRTTRTAISVRPS